MWQLCCAGRCGISSYSISYADRSQRFRLKRPLAGVERKAKTGFIKEALTEYLQRPRDMGCAARPRARRQSMTASEKVRRIEKLWKEAAAEVWDAG